jgi:hypothetical protein
MSDKEPIKIYTGPSLTVAAPNHQPSDKLSVGEVPVSQYVGKPQSRLDLPGHTLPLNQRRAG